MRHEAVLKSEVLESLDLSVGDRVVDATLGDGGHSEDILQIIGESGRLLGIDADPEAILRTKKFLKEYENKIIFVRDNFVNLQKIISENSFLKPNAILFDLGWSTPQFADRGRGLSFGNPEEKLDMRYDSQKTKTAEEILNNYTREQLFRIFREYGEEKFSIEIAREITKTRKKQEIKKVGDLLDIILRVYRRKLKIKDDRMPWLGGINPATKVFQALRIEVNDELNVLREVLPQAVDVLAPGGKLAVISFHSLEDRIVKHFFKSQKDKTLKIINKKPIIATEQELSNNPRARSAKLRVVEKI